jgi:hypothetical protein
VIWWSKGPTCEPSSTSLLVSSEARICPVSASARCAACARTGASGHHASFGARTWSWHRQPFGAAAQGRLIWHSQIQTQELEDRADQSLCLTQCQPEHRPQRQGHPDRQSRVVGLTTSRGARLGLYRPDALARLLGVIEMFKTWSKKVKLRAKELAREI